MHIVCSLHGSDLLRGLDTVLDRKLDIHEYKVEIACFPLIDGFLTIVCNAVFDALSLQESRQNDLIDRIIYSAGVSVREPSTFTKTLLTFYNQNIDGRHKRTSGSTRCFLDSATRLTL